MRRKKRPVGVKILGALVVLTGIALVLIGMAGVFVSLAGLIPGSGISFTALFLGGLLFFALGVVLLIAGGGLLAMRTWAWWLAVFAALVALANTLYGAWSLRGFDLVASIASALEVIILAYLVSVYRSFRPRPGTVA